MRMDKWIGSIKNPRPFQSGVGVTDYLIKPSRVWVPLVRVLFPSHELVQGQ